MTGALPIDRDCIGLQGLDKDPPWRFVAGLDLAMRQCDDGVLVFDETQNVTHLIADEAWDLYCRLCATDIAGQQGRVFSSAGPAQSAEAEEEAMIDALETAGLLRRC